MSQLLSSTSYKHILALTWPMLLANLSMPLLGIVDTLVLGHLDQPIYLAGVALGSMLISLIFWSFGFLRMATTGFTARALGAGNHNEVMLKLKETIIFGLFIGTAILALHPLFLHRAVEWVSKGNVETAKVAYEYVQFRIWSAPGCLILFAMIGWLMGLKKSVACMWILVVTNLVNMVLDVVFVMVLDMRADGVAIATVISDYIGLGLAIYFVVMAMSGPALKKTPIRWFAAINWGSINALFISSRHLFFRTLCLMAVMLFFTSHSSSLGTSVLAANAILLQILSVTAYTMDGFAYAAETLCGHAWGARNKKDFRLVCYRTTLLAASCSVFFVMLLWLGKPLIIGGFTQLPDVIAAATDVYLWLALLPIIGIWSYQLDGIFIGIGHTAQMQNSMLISVFLVFFPLWYVATSLGNHGLWLAFWGFYIARALGLLPAFLKILRQPVT